MSFHGGDIYTAQEKNGRTEWLDFSANINPFGVPNSVRHAIIQSIERLVHYPDPEQRKLRQALAEYHQVPPSHIVCGNGGADIIFRTIQTISPKHALVPVPTFSEYAKALEETGSLVTYWEMDSTFSITDQLLIEMERGHYDFLALCNPNNPTGKMVPPSLMRKILDLAKKKNIFVLLDECFYEMTEDTAETDSMLRELQEHWNVLIVRSMTKLYAIPGIRLGYGICADSVRTQQIRTLGQPWHISTLAEAAGQAALLDHTYRIQFLTFLQEERQFLYQRLQQFPLQVWKPHANFVFFRAAGCFDLAQRLLPYGILLRHCANYVGLTLEYYRVAVRTHEENIYFLECLQKVLAQ